MTTPTSPPPSLPSRADRLRAMRAARFAALRGLPATACPYPANGTPRERVLVLVFIREYLRHSYTNDDGVSTHN